MSLAGAARRPWYEEVAASCVELNSEGLGRCADGKRALPELSVVLVGERNSTFGRRPASEASIIRIGEDGKRMSFASVVLVCREPTVVFAAKR